MAEHINIKAVLPVSIKSLQSKEIIFMLNNITQKEKTHKLIYVIF
ncbi:protein of unknown function [Streptococcus thermophilus]|uniref:Uncharacterized protein n=1 Tax=Streptococcus thermophilus TaxID=1308 RepID=A0A8D6U616_STRTR|nr:protein of unknown function [Streptococcus thermophilus]